MSPQEIINKLKLLREPELVKFRDFINKQNDFPPRYIKLAKEFILFAPDKNGGDAYKTHVFNILKSICDEIRGFTNRGFTKPNFISLIEKIQPDESQIIAIIDNQEKENRNSEEKDSEQEKWLDDVKKETREEIAKERSDGETNNSLAQAKKEAERKEAEARATEAVRREAERKEAEARAKKQAEERAKKQAEARARREAEENVKKATNKAYNAAQRARSPDGSRKHPLRNPPKPPTQRFVLPDRSNRSQKKPENLTDFEVFKQYYEGFCNIYNHTILDDQSLQSNFESLNSKQYKKFITKNGSLQEDNNKIDEVEFEKFLKHQDCLVDDKDPLFLALREYYLFKKFKENFNTIKGSSNIIKGSSNINNYQNITDIQLKETFDSFRSGEFKISYQGARQYEKKVVDDYFKGLGSDYPESSDKLLYKSKEHERINEDEIFFAYNLVKVAYLSTNLTSEDGFPKSSSQSQTSNEDHWQNILSSIENAKSHLLKLSEELKGIKLPELPQLTLPKIQLPELNQEPNNYIELGLNKVQYIVKFFESLSNQNKAPISYPVQSFEPISRANSCSPKKENGAINKPIDEVHKPRGQTINGETKIAYFGVEAKKLQEKHKKVIEINGKSL